MANELICVYPTGNTLYAHVFDATGQIYNGSTFEAPGSTNWANYDITMSEAATSTQIYRATMPGVAAGAYSFVVRKQAGGSPAVADIAVGTGETQWDGSAVSTLDEIRDDTNELQTDWVNGGRLDQLIDDILADTGTDGVVLANDAITAAKVAADAITSSELAASAANKIADHILRRSWATAAASADGDTKAFRSLLGAAAKLVNRVAIVGSTLTVYESDDSTSLGTQTTTSSGSADPIIEVDTD